VITYFFLAQVSAVSVALMDKNVLVQRVALDIVSILFPFHQSFLLPPDLTSILTAALHTLLKRDVSLSRRLYVWLLGTQVDKSSLVNCVHSPSSDLPMHDNVSTHLEASYFEKYSKVYLYRSLGDVMVHARDAAGQGSSKVDCILPYRMLRALQERQEISTSIMECVMLDLVKCLKVQIEQLGGIATSQSKEISSLLSGDTSAKKSGKKGSLKADIIQSANLLFSSLGQNFVWEWIEAMLTRGVASMQDAVAVREEEVVEDTHEKGREGNGNLVAGWKDHVRTLSPVSDLFDSGQRGKERENDGEDHGGDKGVAVWRLQEPNEPLKLKSLLGLFIFLIQVLPQVSLELSA
jgi:hypothetical protein